MGLVKVRYIYAVLCCKLVIDGGQLKVSVYLVGVVISGGLDWGRGGGVFSELKGTTILIDDGGGAV